MPESVARCPLCSGNRHGLFDRREFRGLTVDNQRCLECGFIFQSPRMTGDELEAFYQTEYRRLYDGCEDPSGKNLAAQQARADSLLRFVRPRMDRIGSHLDIGCSTGLFLKKMGEVYGCQSVGVEPGRAFRTYARGLGQEVYEDLDALKRRKDLLFDLISMVHVLEHLPDPVSYLMNLRDTFLGSDGLLLVEVPNLYAHACFEVAHLVSFSAQTLKETLRKAGFTVVFFEKHERPRLEIIPYYLTVLARKTPHPVSRSVRVERNVALKRKVGMLRSRLLLRLVPRRVWKGIKRLWRS